MQHFNPADFILDTIASMSSDEWTRIATVVSGAQQRESAAAARGDATGALVDAGALVSIRARLTRAFFVTERCGVAGAIVFGGWRVARSWECGGCGICDVLRGCIAASRRLVSYSAVVAGSY